MIWPHNFIIIQQRIQSNMSYNLLPLDNEEMLHNLPSLNRINNTLQLIETVKSIPNHSLTCLDPPQINEHLNQEDSLEVEIQLKQKRYNVLNNSFQLQTPESKKKKSGCTCKKTQCLKMYCECFALGKLCTPECACYSCCNTDENPALVQKAKTNIKSKTSRKTNKGGGCTCKKSHCQKKYCECFNAGRGCTDACKCCDCENHRDDGPFSQNSDMNLEGEPNKTISINSRVEGSAGKDNGQIKNEEWESDLDISGQVLESEKKKVELTSHKEKKRSEIENQNMPSCRSFKSIDLCCYFN